jgi:AcrR family transcriptional regulator
VPTEVKAGPAGAIELARRRILDGQPVRMQELAGELGVTRVTLHRWVGSREQLIGEAWWSLAQDTLTRAERGVPTRGARRIANIVGRYLEIAHASDGMRAFLEREPEFALRVLTTQATPVQARSVAEVERLISEAVEAGDLEVSMDAHDLAYVIVRVGESFLYADVITGEQPDIGKARAAIEQLLR